MSKIAEDFKQYGFFGFLKRIAKWFLRMIGIRINSYYYMVNDIDYDKQRRLFESKGLTEVKELDYNDFLKGDKTEFTEKKLKRVKQRLDDNGYHAYGIIENGKLVYSCWISLNWLESHNKCIEGPLSENECLLVDAYCAPEGRGRGFHNTMNSYRLMKAYEHGKRRSIGIVLSENVPAFKSQIKTGNRVLFKFYVADLWGKTCTNYFKNKAKAEMT
jgi:hypothetical protein